MPNQSSNSPAIQPASIARQSASLSNNNTLENAMLELKAKQFDAPSVDELLSDLVGDRAQRAERCKVFMAEQGMGVVGELIARGMTSRVRKDFLLDSASTAISVMLLRYSLASMPAPMNFQAGNTYLVGFPLFDRTSGDRKLSPYRCVIGDIDLLMAAVRKEEHGIKALTSPSTKKVFADYFEELEMGCKSIGLWLSKDEVANMAAALTINKVSTKTTTIPVLASHLCEVLKMLGMMPSRVHAVNAAWNLPRYGADRAIVRKVVNALLRAQEGIGMTGFKFIDMAVNDNYDDVVICGQRFVVDNEGVIYDANGTSKRLNQIMLAAPIKVGRSLQPNEYSIMSAHDVLLYLIDNIALPMINRKDVKSDKSLEISRVLETNARAAQSIVSFLGKSMPLNERAVALGVEDAASSILTSGEISCVVKWHQSLFRRNIAAEGREIAIYKEGMLVGPDSPYKRSADQTEREIFSQMELKTTTAFNDYHPLIEPMLNHGKVIQPFGNMNAVSLAVHGTHYAQLPIEKQVEAVKAFWDNQGMTEEQLCSTFNLGDVIGDVWLHIAEETFSFLSYKGSKRFKRSANLYAQVTTFAYEESSRFQWSAFESHDIHGLPLKAVLAPSYVFSGPGMAYMNAHKREQYEMRYPLAGGMHDYYDNSRVFATFAIDDAAIITNPLTGWSHVDLDIKVREGQETGLYIVNEHGHQVPLKAEHNGVLCKVRFRTVDKFSVTGVLECRLFYKVSEFDFKLRAGYKAMTTYHDGSIFDHNEYAPQWDIIVPGDSNKTLDLLTCFLPEAAESFGRVPEGTLVDGVDVRELLRSLNAEALGREGIIKDAANDKLFINMLMLNEGKYEQLRKLFMKAFGQVMWLAVDSVEMQRFTEKFYAANVAGGGAWRVMTEEEIASVSKDGVPKGAKGFCDTPDITDVSNILVTYSENGKCMALHRQWVYASTPDMTLYMLGKPEYTTVSQSVSESSVMGNVIYDLALRSNKAAMEFVNRGEINRVRYSLIQRLAKGLPIAIDGVEVPVLKMQGSIAAIVEHRSADLSAAYAEGPNQFFQVLLEICQDKVLRFETDNSTWVNIYLPLLASYGGQDLESNEGMTLASKVYELMTAWYNGADAKSQGIKVTAGEISKMMRKLAEGGRMQKSLTYGPKGVGFKVAALPNIPTGELWVYAGGEVFAKMRKLFGKAFAENAFLGDSYVGIVRAPMTRVGVFKVVVITKPENSRMAYKVNGVQGYISPFSQYFNMGDFDGDGDLSMDVSDLVHAGELQQDSYASMLKFQRETLGYDMMLPEFWKSSAPEQYYADHFYVQSYKSVMGKIGGRGLNLKSAEKANTITRAQLLAGEHGAIGQQTSFVSSSYQTQFFATLAAEILKYLPVDAFKWIGDSTYQTQALYEVALGGYSPDMCRVAFGLLDRAFRLSTTQDWWLKRVDPEVAGMLDQGVVHSASSLLGTEPNEQEKPLFTSLGEDAVFPAMQASGFGWNGFEEDRDQVQQFIQIAAIAGIAKKRVSEAKSDSAGIATTTFQSLGQTYGRNMTLVMALAQRLMDISRNKAEFGKEYDDVLRAELNHALRGLDSESVSVNLYWRIEKALNDSVSSEAVSYDSAMINKLCKFVEAEDAPSIAVGSDAAVAATVS